MRPLSYLQAVWVCLFRKKEPPPTPGLFTVKAGVPVDLEGMSDEDPTPPMVAIAEVKAVQPILFTVVPAAIELETEEAEVDRSAVNLENVIYWMNKLGHPVKADGSLNIVGLRSIPGVPDQFDDVLIDFSKHPLTGEWDFYMSPGTTDPGAYHLKNPSRIEGTFIMKPGYYPACWKIGYHHAGQPSAYRALVQARAKAFLGWRDRDKDGSPNYGGAVYDDCDGVNAHHAGEDSPKIDKWSAGCWVWKRLADYAVHMRHVDRHISEGHGELFDACLIEWPQPRP